MFLGKTPANLLLYPYSLSFVFSLEGFTTQFLRMDNLGSETNTALATGASTHLTMLNKIRILEQRVADLRQQISTNEPASKH